MKNKGFLIFNSLDCFTPFAMTGMSHISHRTSHISHRISHIAHRISHISHRTSHIAHLTSQIALSFKKFAENGNIHY